MNLFDSHLFPRPRGRHGTCFQATCLTHHHFYANYPSPSHWAASSPCTTGHLTTHHTFRKGRKYELKVSSLLQHKLVNRAPTYHSSECRLHTYTNVPLATGGQTTGPIPSKLLRQTHQAATKTNTGNGPSDDVRYGCDVRCRGRT